MKIDQEIKTALENIAFGLEVALREESQTNFMSFQREEGFGKLDRTVTFEFPSGATFFVSIKEPVKKVG